MYITLEDSDTNNDPVKYTYLLSDFILVLMILRIVFMFRAIMKFNIFYKPFTIKLFRSYGNETSLMLTLKALLQTQPENTCIVLFISTSVVFAYWIRIFEVPFQRAAGTPNFDDFLKSLWFTIVTLFTIGYGDYYPCSRAAKVVVVILAFWGAVLLAIVVVSISNIFAIDGKNKVALSHL